MLYIHLNNGFGGVCAINGPVSLKIDGEMKFYRWARSTGPRPPYPGSKRLRKKCQIWPKITKNEKNRTYHQNVRNFVRNSVTTFFFDFGPVLTHFWPFYWFWAVGPIQGSRAKKTWQKSEIWPKNHQKWKKSNLLSKCAEFCQESRGNFFFFDFGPVLTPIRPFYWSSAVGPIWGSRAKKT